METLLIPTQASAVLPGYRILILAPHPDDEVFGCGGAILSHVERGHPVHVIIATDGTFGVAAADQQHHATVRRQESIAAARLLGYGTPEFWGGKDRELFYGEQLVQRILIAITAHQADLVYAPCVLEMHPDHRALALAAVEAVRRLGPGARLAQYEVGTPLRPNTLLDISALAARKQAAMECFTSQNAQQRYDLHIAALNRYRTYSLPASVTAAEAYAVADGGELADDPLQLLLSEHQRQQQLGLPLDSRDLPLVSVLVRSTDRPTLAKALDSIALQTYANIEVVVVNALGTSHRAQGEWCGRFPLRLVDGGKPLTRSEAANLALASARGVFMLFLDDDDWLLPQHIARSVSELTSADQAVATYSAIACVDEHGSHLRHFAQAFDPIRFRIENFIPIHAVLFRRQAVDKGAHFDTALNVCEDWDFWLQLLQFGTFRFIPETGGIYLMHGNTSSDVWDDPDQTRAVMLQIYRKWLPTWNDDTVWKVLEYTRYQTLHGEVTESLRDAQATLAEQEIQLAANLKEIAGQNSQIAILNATLAERDARLDALYKSTSWRITKPLRDLVGLLRKNPSRLPMPENAAPAVASTASASPATAQHVYDYLVDPDSPTAPAFVMQLVGTDKRVLEVGCGPGSITRMLAGQGRCKVTGIELDVSAIELARPYCEKIVQGDLNKKSWPSLLADLPPFDSVVAADVLEHLYDPWSTLKRMARFIGPEGSLVISLPHAGHAAVAACLMNGDFDYRDWGLLDRTHIRFFGLKNIDDLFSQAGLKIIDARFVIKPVDQTEFADNWNRLPEQVKTALKSSKHADIYQVVVKAVPLDRPGQALILQPA